MNKKARLFLLPYIALTLGVTFLAGTAGKFVEESDAYNSSSLPTANISLKDCTDSEIRSYYSSITTLSEQNRRGSNFLGKLKSILSNGQKYYSYDSGSAIWQIYELADRDWEKSPASQIATYNASTQTIASYTYGTNSSHPNNPYLHALYNNRNVDNQTVAWGAHGQAASLGVWSIDREHVWSKSHGFDETGQGGARGDPMHLMASNSKVNNAHSNNFYGYVDLSHITTDCGQISGYSHCSGNYLGYPKNISSSVDVFEPQDSDKGDIARALFYMAARYNNFDGSTSFDTNNPNLQLIQAAADSQEGSYVSTSDIKGSHGIISDLLNWNRIDPPDEFEIHRNNILYRNFTNNRNPFIDYPEWAEYIWGTAEYDGRTLQSYNSTPTNSANLSTDVINGFNGEQTDTVTLSASSMELAQNEAKHISAVSSDGSSISWSLSENDIVTISSATSSSGSSITITGSATGSVVLTASATINGKKVSSSCAIKVKQGGSGVTGDFELIDDASTLSAGDKIIVAGSSTDVALSTVANQYNRGLISITRESDTISWDSSASVTPQIITLGGTTNAWTLSVGDGKYLAAGSSETYNNLLTNSYDSSIPDEAKWTISIDENCIATVAANRYTRNHIRCNSSSSRFSCYTSTSSAETIKLYRCNESSTIPVTGITINQSSLNVVEGDNSNTLVATVSPENATEKTVIWSSSNEGLLTVTDGTIYPKSTGTAIVTAATLDGDFKATCEVTVTEDPVVDIEINLDSSCLSYFYDEQFDQSKIIVEGIHTNISNTIIENNDCTFSIENGKTFTSSDGSSIILTVNYGGFSDSTAISLSEKSGAIYKQTSKTAVTGTNVYSGSSATFSCDASTKAQLTSGKVMTLTLSGYNNQYITGISLLMKSNTSTGAGYLIISCGGSTIGSIGSSTEPLSFEDEGFNGYFSTLYKYLNITINSGVICEQGDEITIEIHATENSLFCSSFVITYLQAPVLTSLSLSGNYQTSFALNESFSHEGMVVTANYDVGDPINVTQDASWSTVDTSTTGTKKVTVSYKGIEKDYLIVVTNGGTSVQYEKVTSNLVDWSGTYLLVSSYISNETTYNCAWTGVDAASSYSNVSITNNVISSIDSSIVTLTISSMTGGYSIKINGGKNNNKYIGGVSDSNIISFSDTAMLNTISYNDSAFISSNTSVLRFNSSSNNLRFRYYKSSTYSSQNEVNLYKSSSVTDQNLITARNYSLRLCNSIVCYNGSSTPIISGTTWSELSTIFSTLTNDAKAYLVNATYTVSGSVVTPLGDTDQGVAEGMARYDQLVSRYSYDNFINRNIAVSSSPTIKQFIETSSGIIVFIILGIVALGGVGGYLYVRRKHD